MTRILIFLLVLSTGQAVAEDLQVYESIDQLAIGRVFLKPADRAALDQRRHQPLRAVASSQGSSQSSQPSQPRRAADRPAGYIQSSSGRRSNWRDGEFIADGRAPRSRFPGDVPVERHEPPVNTKDDDERADD